MRNRKLNRNSSPIGLVTLSMLFIGLLISSCESEQKLEGSEGYNFALKDTARITKIYLGARDEKSIQLEREEGGGWKVNGKYGVRKDAIETLLTTIADVELLMPVPKPKQPQIIKSLSSSSVKVEIYEGEEVVKAYFVGGPTEDHKGTYMLMQDPKSGKNYDQPYVTFMAGLNGFLTTRYFTDLGSWRSRAVFEYDPSKIASVTLALDDAVESSFTLIQVEKNNYELRLLNTTAPLSGLDLFATKQYLNYFQRIHYEAIASELRVTYRDSILKLNKFGSLVVSDKSGEENKVGLYYRNAPDSTFDARGRALKYDRDRFYLRIPDEENLAIAQFFVFDKLLVDPSYFIKK